MPPRDDCPQSDHQAPASGGSCACGMVTRIPVAEPPQSTDVRDVLARCLDDEPGGVDRVLAAFADAGLVVAPETRLRPPA